MRTWPDSTGDLEIEKTGVGTTGCDQLLTAELEIGGRRDVYPGKAGAQALEVEIEMEDGAGEYLEPRL